MTLFTFLDKALGISLLTHIISCPHTRNLLHRDQYQDWLCRPRHRTTSSQLTGHSTTSAIACIITRLHNSRHSIPHRYIDARSSTCRVSISALSARPSTPLARANHAPLDQCHRTSTRHMRCQIQSHHVPMSRDGSHLYVRPTV